MLSSKHYISRKKILREKIELARCRGGFQVFECYQIWKDHTMNNEVMREE